MPVWHGTATTLVSGHCCGGSIQACLLLLQLPSTLLLKDDWFLMDPKKPVRTDAEAGAEHRLDFSVLYAVLSTN